jgi:D-serine deaminase-like pyridoxal phosphate-dependent protein
MHRTGIHPEKALDLYQSIEGKPNFRFAGLHAYDGHNASLAIEERRKTTRASVDLLIPLFKQFGKESVRVPKLMMGGTPSFLTDLEYLSRVGLETEIILSPGTWVFFDSADYAIIPGTFDVAACILAQVMDKPEAKTATLNLGYKRWAVDQGPIEVFSIDGMRATAWSEEHTVVSVPKGTDVGIGDYILIAPRHICPTVNLWEHFSIIGPSGEIEVRRCPIEGRNR